MHLNYKIKTWEYVWKPKIIGMGYQNILKLFFVFNIVYTSIMKFHIIKFYMYYWLLLGLFLKLYFYLACFLKMH